MNVTLTHTPRTSRILRMDQVVDRVGLSRASIYRLSKLGLFPKSFKIGISAIGFDEAEIEFWIFERKMGDTLH